MDNLTLAGEVYKRLNGPMPQHGTPAGNVAREDVRQMQLTLKRNGFDYAAFVQKIESMLDGNGIVS